MRGGRVTGMGRQGGLKATRDEGVCGQIRKLGLSDTKKSCDKNLFSRCWACPILLLLQLHIQ